MEPDYPADFYRGRDASTRASARAIVPLIRELAPIRSVLDVGCGVGTWLQVFREAGVEDVFGVEGDWLDLDRLQIPRDRVRAHDLRQPVDLGRQFDLAISLEVAEHLPPEHAEGFVATLVRHAPLVLFSAAVPFQGGRHHVNERWPEYWAGLFADAGYSVADPIRPRVWNHPDVKTWYAQNALLYVCHDRLPELPRVVEAAERTDRQRLSMVHPRLYERNSDPRCWSLRTVLRVLPRLLTGAVRRRLPGGHR